MATHTGIVSYSNGSWSRPDLPINDYMGYSGISDGFFSSGHPGAGSNLINPIGLVKSNDFGASVQTINFLGETDFHVMGASYFGETVMFSTLPLIRSYQPDYIIVWMEE